ncbi:MAG: prephenate dehydrogenase [Lachnospiraceae bacterium]|nr:prephenate dehydrogenase [Lachnospiraceae bacterium]
MFTVGFVGLGLIGGSIARCLRETHPEYHMIACGASEKTLNMALQDGTVDEIFPQVDSHLSACSLIFLCAPVEYNIGYLPVLKKIIHKNCLITDVGSTKAEIHEAVNQLGLSDQFIGGHPMAGSEKSGYSHSNTHLMENAWYVLTPTDDTDPSALELMLECVHNCRAQHIVLNYQEHDRIVAAISHVPHLIAAGLVNLVQDNDNSLHQMKQLAAGGFKDITRIASSSPVMWEQICTSNTAPIADILRKYISIMEGILTDVEKQDGKSINYFFEKSRDYRNTISDKPKAIGYIKPEYSIYCDIVDRAGAIATLATTLSTHQISIKNIGIIHNRSFEDGALKIEFYTEEAMENAIEILSKWNYTITRRK